MQKLLKLSAFKDPDVHVSAQSQPRTKASGNYRKKQT